LHGQPAILEVAIPTYPTLAAHLGLEQEVTATLGISRCGRVKSIAFKTGEKNFRQVVKLAIQKWRFASSQKGAEIVVTFSFKLLPSATKDPPAVIFRLPNRVEIYALRPRIVDPGDRATSVFGDDVLRPYQD